MRIDIQVRPIDQWPGTLREKRSRSKFRATYGATMQLLERELRNLDAKTVVILMAYDPKDLRLDGRPRADTKPKHPGVVLCCETRQGPLKMPCDRWDNWEDNLRAIALSLEALRAVNRFGVTTHRSEQYTGWLALPPPGADITTPEQARELLGRIVGPARVAAIGVPAALREAEMLTHPDRGGRAAEFNRVQQARKVLFQ